MAARIRHIYTVVTPQGVEVVQGCYPSDGAATHAFRHLYPADWRAKANGPIRRRPLRDGEQIAGGAIWSDIEDHNFFQTDPPGWFSESVQDACVESPEVFLLLRRRARYLVSDEERLSVLLGSISSGEGAVRADLATARYVTQLLWTALGALHAAGVVTQVRPSAQG